MGCVGLSGSVQHFVKDVDDEVHSVLMQHTCNTKMGKAAARLGVMLELLQMILTS